MLDSLGEHLLALEEQLLQPYIRTDSAALSMLLAREFREFGSSGRTYTKGEIMDLLSAEAPRSISLSDFVCQRLSPATALVTYRSRSEAGEALRSSIWTEREGRWQMLFHQGTKVAARVEATAVP